MEKHPFFEQVEKGQELPYLNKCPDLRQLVMWAGASEDFNLIHFDRDYARKTGLPDVIVQGPLRICFMGQLVSNWIGEKGRLEEFSSRMLDVVPVNTPLTCKGKVTKKYREGDKKLVELELWIEDPTGKKNTTGSAVVSLP